MTLQELRDEIEFQVTSINQSASAIKSDDVVDDEQVDAVNVSAQRIAEAFNKYLAGGPSKHNREGIESVNVPEELEASPYQE